MTEYLPFSTQEQSYAAGGINPQQPVTSAFDFASSLAQLGRTQQTHETQVAEAAERIKQARIRTKGQEELVAGGVNLEGSDYLPVQEAVALLQANEVKQDKIDEFVQALGDKQFVSRLALQAVILKKGGSGSLALIGAKEGQPMQDEKGEWVRTWTKRTPELGILMTDRISPVGVAVFQAEDPTGYEAGHTMLSIQSPKLDISKMTGEARKTMAEQKVRQNKIINWLELEKRTNPNRTTGQSALGLSGRANQRADRAFGLLAIPNQTWEGLHAVELDLAGILTGGVPQLPTIKEQQIFSPAKERISKFLEFFTAHRTEGLVNPDLERQLFELVQEIKNVDNEIIDKQLGIVEVAAEDIIKQDPQRWERLKDAIIATTESKEQDAAYAKIYGVTKKSGTQPKTASPAHEAKKAALRAKLGI